MRILLFGLLFISSSLFAQRDSVINGIKCHLISESTDTGTAWIQQKVVRKGVTKFNGVCFEIYPGGKLKAKGYYKRGKRTGKWQRFYSSGIKAEEGYFDAGYKTELWMMYFESGKLSWKGNFYKNMRSGIWRYFYEDGKLKAMTRYRIKTESITKKPKEGAKKGMSIRVNREISYSISPADSLVEYYPDGKLRTKIIYGKEGGLTGTYDVYYANGKKNTQGEFLNGKRSGDWQYYCEDGVVYKYVNYSLVNEPKAGQGSDACAYTEMLPWLKWEIEFITP
ncbi:MAG: hypothetical protein M3R17_01935 [Bacteroidota bacterium]|nr:hypothetical protein [Bacteroidota bacterium]